MQLQSFLFQLYFALVSAYLSIVLYKVLKQNGRIMKEMTTGFEKISKEMITGFEKISKEMTTGFEKMSENMTKAFKATWGKMDETNKLIARLIVEENEKKEGNSWRFRKVKIGLKPSIHLKLSLYKERNEVMG